MPALDNFWAVIPAGGAGTRLWPLSRRSSPKFLHDLSGSGQSLLQDTWTRLAPLAGDRFLVVTGRAHQHEVREQLPAVGPDGVLAEPSPRDRDHSFGSTSNEALFFTAGITFHSGHIAQVSRKVGPSFGAMNMTSGLVATRVSRVSDTDASPDSSGSGDLMPITASTPGV